MLQVIIRKKDRASDKAVRYLKERRIPYQTLNIDEKELSRKEWESIFSSAGDIESLIDRDSQFYKKNGYAWREYDAREELIMHPELLRLPVFRKGQKCRFDMDDAWLRENA